MIRDTRKLTADIEQEIARRRAIIGNEPSYSRTRLEVEMQIRGLLDALQMIEMQRNLEARTLVGQNRYS